MEAFDLLADPDFEPEEDPTVFAVNLVTDLLRLTGVRVAVSSRAPETPMDGLDHARAVVDVTALEDGDDLSMLVGEGGESVAALQYVVNVILSRSLDGEHPITVDVDGYKRRREEELNNLATSAAAEARRSHEPQELEPMSPAERRIVHLALSEEDDVETESEGSGDARRVVIVYREAE
jgi:predicted RNA-binding protein Jag